MTSLAVMQRRLERWRARQAQEGQVACALWENGPCSFVDLIGLCQRRLSEGVLERTLARMLRDKQVTREWRRDGGTRWYVWSLYHGGRAWLTQTTRFIAVAGAIACPHCDVQLAFFMAESNSRDHAAWVVTWRQVWRRGVSGAGD